MSPDGKWLAFASDRNTDWKGHSDGKGWEHVQELRIYVMKPDGTGLRKLSRDSVCSGSPKWSPDGKRVIFYELPVEATWAARGSGPPGPPRRLYRLTSRRANGRRIPAGRG